jgi:hypothetical protein
MKRLNRQVVSLLSGIASLLFGSMALCIFSACALEPFPAAPGAAAGKTGRVVISIAGEEVSPASATASAARTLLPIYDSLVYDYEFTASGMDPVSGSFEKGTAGSADLETGTWELTVRGKKDGTEVLTGSVSGIVINPGEAISVNVAMARVLQTGNGDLSYMVSFPDTVSKGYLRVFNLSGTLKAEINLLDGAESDNGEGTKTANGSQTLAEGYYRVGLHLSTSDAVLNRIVLAHVYMALTTPVSHAFTDADFLPDEANFPQTSLAGALADIGVVFLSEGIKIHYDLPAGSESMGPTSVSRADGPITVIIDGGGRTVTLADTGSLITLGNNVTLVLKNITLAGRGIESGNPMNNAALVTVASGGKLELGTGALITGNKNSSNGGGVYVASNGTLNLCGGEIRGNTVSGYGGGVYVDSGGIFTKQPGGTIYGVDANGTFKNTAFGYSYGHAVYVSADKRLNLTISTGDSLDSTKNGAEGGWVEPLSANPSLDETLAWLSAYAVEGGAYTINLSGNESSAPIALSYSGKTVAITFLGDAAERTVSLTASGPLFTVGSGVTLTLGNNITLQGRSDNTSALVVVESGGKLEMNSGSKISGNSVSGYNDSYGGGVYVCRGGTFTMSGGTISGNSSVATYTYGHSYGGGVYVSSGGTFTMSGGTINGNSSSGSPSYGGSGGGVSVGSGSEFTMSGGEISGNEGTNGGGVEVSGGEFTMSGGIISGNTAPAPGAYSHGGGVYVNGAGSVFTMSGGEISNNESRSGGGVYVSNSGEFTMNSGSTISNNKARYSGAGFADGGGVDLTYGGTLTMNGGEISDNTATSRGGGVDVYYLGRFAMSGGTISGNTAGDGGGVSVYLVSSGTYECTFTKQSGGIIYGSDTGDTLENTAGTGAAIYASASVYRDTTVGEGENLSTENGATWLD